MNIPPHLESLRRSKLMGECQVCGEVTDLQIAHLDGPEWRCWRCQGLPEMAMHKQCEGCQAWFVGMAANTRCGHGPGCQEQQR
jgi:hypothetical protein